MKKVILAVILFIVFAAVTSMGMLAYRYYSADVRGVVDAQEQITSGGNRVQEYEQFFGMCNNVKDLMVTRDSQERMLEDAESSKERSRIRQTLSGLEAQISRNVNDYNSSAQQYTTARFKDSSLPERISISQEPQCGQ